MYSREELVAEFGAAFLCARAGIDNTLDNSAAYIAGWSHGAILLFGGSPRKDSFEEPE